jgi:hypothetical protein
MVSKEKLGNLIKLNLTILICIIGMVFIGLSSFSIIPKASFFNEFFKNLGFVFVPTTLVAFLIGWSKTMKEATCVYKDFRIFDVYHNRTEFEEKYGLNNFFIQNIGKGICKVDILTPDLTYLDRHKDDFAKYVNDGKLKIRILCLDPDSDCDFIETREAELYGHDENLRFRPQIHAALDRFYETKLTKINEEYQDKFIIKTFESSPSIVLFRANNKILISFLLRGGKARNHAHVGFDFFVNNEKRNPGQCFILNHFNLIWEKDGKVYQPKNRENV